jgi:F0F1-type ATP synthase assembly protein I
MNHLEAIAHATSVLFLIGMMVFFWIIYKKTRKVYRRGQKAKRRERKYNKTK